MALLVLPPPRLYPRRDKYGRGQNAAVASRLFLSPLEPCFHLMQIRPAQRPSAHASARIDRVAPRQRRHDSTTAHSSIIAALPQRTKGAGVGKKELFL
jgi:hypothetical protein